MEEISKPGIAHHNLDPETRRTLARAALLLALSRSENCRAQAFRTLINRYGIPASQAELEIEQATLGIEALRAIAEVKA